MSGKKKENEKFTKIPAVIAIIVLLLTFIDWDSYSYYTFMKFIVTGVMFYHAYFIYEILKKINHWFWGSVGTAVLFNPVIPIHLGDKDLWMVIDILVIGFLISSMIKINRTPL